MSIDMWLTDRHMALHSRLRNVGGSAAEAWEMSGYLSFRYGQCVVIGLPSMTALIAAMQQCKAPAVPLLGNCPL